MFLTINNSVVEHDHINQKGFQTFSQYTSQQTISAEFEKIKNYQLFLN